MALRCCCCRRPPAYTAVDTTDMALLGGDDDDVEVEPPPGATLSTVPLAQIPTNGCVYCGRRAPLVVGQTITVDRAHWLMLPPEQYISICACTPVHVGCVVQYVAGLAPEDARSCAICQSALALPRALIGDRPASDVVLAADAAPDQAPDQWPLTTPAPLNRPWRGLRLRRGHVDVWPVDGAPVDVPPDLHAVVDARVVAEGSSDVDLLAVPWADVAALLAAQPPKVNTD